LTCVAEPTPEPEVEEPKAPNTPPTPIIVGQGKDFVTLLITPPPGDVPVDGYIVQYMADGETKWREMPTKDTDVTIPNLTPGKSYIFRVAAQNDAGVSDYSAPTNTITLLGKYIFLFAS
jgi:hypothetical protein